MLFYALRDNGAAKTLSHIDYVHTASLQYVFSYDIEDYCVENRVYHIDYISLQYVFYYDIGNYSIGNRLYHID